VQDVRNISKEILHAITYKGVAMLTQRKEQQEKGGGRGMLGCSRHGNVMVRAGFRVCVLGSTRPGTSGEDTWLSENRYGHVRSLGQRSRFDGVCEREESDDNFGV
jgi:hypothetical protein